MQLTAETVEMAVSMLAQVIEGSARNENEQNSTVLEITASYLTDLATFLNNSNETINSIVSGIKRKSNVSLTQSYTNCSRWLKV